MSDPHRSTRRYDQRLAIEYTASEDWVSSHTKNLSLGGVFVECDSKMPYGTRLKLRFHVPTQKERIEVSGQIRWVDDSGFGVQFDGLRARDVWALGKFFERDKP
jgi:uncharacterized protein (TIGR02266 family)